MVYTRRDWQEVQNATETAGIALVVALWLLSVATASLSPRIELIQLEPRFGVFGLANSFAVTLGRVVLGGLLAVAFGVSLAILLRLASLRLSKLSLPLIFALAVTPATIWQTFSVLLMGLREVVTLVVVFASAAFFVSAISVFQAIQIPRRPFFIGELYSFSLASRARNILLPHLAQHVTVTMRISLLVGWTSIIMAESAGARSGLGALLIFGRQLYDWGIVNCAWLTIIMGAFATDTLARTLAHHLPINRDRAADELQTRQDLASKSTMNSKERLGIDHNTFAQQALEERPLRGFPPVALHADGVSKDWEGKGLLTPSPTSLSYYSSDGLLLIRGQNGCGKSTLLNILSGELKPTAGQIARSNDFNEKLACMFQRDGLLPFLTIRENLRAAGISEVDILNYSEQFRIVKLLDRSSDTLSGGEAQRVQLARLVLSGRPLWFLDEPTASIDTAGREILSSCCLEHLRAGNGIILISHDDDWIKDLALFLPYEIREILLEGEI